MVVTQAERIAEAVAFARALMPNATPLEHATLAVEIACIADADPRLIATVWNPWKCPAALLPWLAWAVSVDVWDPAWTEARKRSVIAASPQVHRLKGVRGAVERALAALGLETNIVEWWETEPIGRRGTFHVDAIFDDGSDAPTQILTDQALDTIRASKPHSRPFSFESAVNACGGVYVAAAPDVQLYVEALPAVFDPPEVEAAIGITTAPEHHLSIEVST